MVPTFKEMNRASSLLPKKLGNSFTYIMLPRTDTFTAEDNLFNTLLSIPLKEQSEVWKVDIKGFGSILQVIQLDIPWRTFI